MDATELRDALGCFATGITIVTTVGPRGELIGITANSFNSVSLDPPLILFSLNRRAHSLRVFLSTQTFAVNILREDQEALSKRFAQALEDKWSGVEYETWDTGAPGEGPGDRPARRHRFEGLGRVAHDCTRDLSGPPK